MAHTIYAALFLAGFGIPIMAALNASLGTRLDSPLAAVLVLSVVAALCSLTLLTITGHPNWGQLRSVHPAQLMAGTIFVFYLGTITFGAPRIGLGNAVILILFGQIVCSTAIDHFAFLGAIKHPISPQRIIGVLMLGMGVALARS
ncbi:DMT family transporter [Erythrobacter sp. GH1-10]|uniref:DMT family transporter n=1 Tax=Erythrobacter sp. GH1-10 TaxID=3349334 RepID=UPI0038780499